MLWTKTYGSGLHDAPRDIAKDDRGNILVAGDRSDRERGPFLQFPQGQLVSLSPAGDVNWVVLFPTGGARTASSFVAVAVGRDGDPVVSGHSEVRSDTPVMHTLKYSFDTLLADHKSSEGGEQDHGPHDNRLAWDQPMSDTVTGYRVCIDDETGTACQDLGTPEDLHPRTMPSTTPGSRTYEIALSKLTTFRPGKRRISVVAYNEAGRAASAVLTVMGRSGQHTK